MTTPMSPSIVDAYCALIRERSRLQEKAYKIGYWLDDNPDHPQHEKRTQVWINTTEKYARTCDQIKELEDAYDNGADVEPVGNTSES